MSAPTIRLPPINGNSRIEISNAAYGAPKITRAPEPTAASAAASGFARARSIDAWIAAAPGIPPTAAAGIAQIKNTAAAATSNSASGPISVTPSAAYRISPPRRRASLQPFSNDARPVRHASSAIKHAAPRPNSSSRMTRKLARPAVPPPIAPPPYGVVTKPTRTLITAIKSGMTTMDGLRSSSGTALAYTPRSSPAAGARFMLRPGARQRAAARARALGRRVLDDLEDSVLHALVVAREHLHHFVVRHRLHARLAFEPDVVVGDQRDVHVTHLELAREIRLGIVGHVDDLPAQRAEPLRLRARGEARALDDDDRALVVRVDVQPAQRVDRDRPQLRAVRIGERDVRRHGAVVERVLAPARAVDDLVGDHHRAGLHVRLQRAAGRRADDPRDAERLHRVRVGAVVDRLRGIAVVLAVARQEGDLLAGDLAQRDLVRGQPVGRLDPDFARVLDERVEPVPAVNADIGAFVRHVHCDALG